MGARIRGPLRQETIMSERRWKPAKGTRNGDDATRQQVGQEPAHGRFSRGQDVYDGIRRRQTESSLEQNGSQVAAWGVMQLKNHQTVEAIRAVAKLLRLKFPNLTADETISLAGAITSAVVKASQQQL